MLASKTASLGDIGLHRHVKSLDADIKNIDVGIHKMQTTHNRTLKRTGVRTVTSPLSVAAAKNRAVCCSETHKAMSQCTLGSLGPVIQTAIQDLQHYRKDLKCPRSLERQPGYSDVQVSHNLQGPHGHSVYNQGESQFGLG